MPLNIGVGLGVIADNLLRIARASPKPKKPAGSSEPDHRTHR
jgi:hypothetical protein